jgi:hypothetical protein
MILCKALYVTWVTEQVGFPQKPIAQMGGAHGWCYATNQQVEQIVEQWMKPVDDTMKYR